MSEVTLFSGLLIKLYSNKNFNTFKSGLLEAEKKMDISGMYGIIYDDYDVKEELKKKWIKEYKEIKIFNVSRRRKTIRMDSKILFAKKMKDSIYTPLTYLNFNEISETGNKNRLFFIKKDGSTGSRHVFISKYQDLSTTISSLDNACNYIIQESMSSPDLYEDKRYKIRVHVILHDKKLYLHKKTFATVSSEKYTMGGLKEELVGIGEDKLKKMNVICQANSEKFILYNDIENYDLIEDNIVLALKDFNKYYINEINEITENEFCILGFDFVVDSNKNVNIIEINHRSNYHHPENISSLTDKKCMEDLIILLISKDISNTDLYKIDYEEDETFINVEFKE